jgi:hypothetical protein
MKINKSAKVKGTPGKKAKASVRVNKNEPIKVISKEWQSKGQDTVQDILYEEGDLFAKKLQLNILQQVLGHAALTPAYQRWKAKNQLDPRILIATGAYVSAIKAKKLPDGSVEINVPDETHPTAKISYRLLGAVHEFGQIKWQNTGRGIPARPHWRPTIQWWLKKRRQETVKAIEKALHGKMWVKLKYKIGNKEYTVQ